MHQTRYQERVTNYHTISSHEIIMIYSISLFSNQMQSHLWLDLNYIMNSFRFLNKNLDNDTIVPANVLSPLKPW